MLSKLNLDIKLINLLLKCMDIIAIHQILHILIKLKATDLILEKQLTERSLVAMIKSISQWQMS